MGLTGMRTSLARAPDGKTDCDDPDCEAIVFNCPEGSTGYRPSSEESYTVPLFEDSYTLPLSEPLFQPMGVPTPTCGSDNLCTGQIGSSATGGVTSYTYTGDVSPGANFTIRFRQSNVGATGSSGFGNKQVVFAMKGFDMDLEGFPSGPGATDGDPTIFVVLNYSSSTDLNYNSQDIGVNLCPQVGEGTATGKPDALHFSSHQFFGGFPGPAVVECKAFHDRA